MLNGKAGANPTKKINLKPTIFYFRSFSGSQPSVLGDLKNITTENTNCQLIRYSSASANGPKVCRGPPVKMHWLSSYYM